MVRFAWSFSGVVLLAAACSPTQPRESAVTAAASERFPVTSVGSPSWYPNGPYGFGVGHTVPNLSFQGKSGFASGASDLSLRPISLSDFQRHASTKTSVLVITACAEWCLPCQREQADLNFLWEHYQQTHPGEVVFLHAMVQSASMAAANERTVDRWSRRFAVPYDLVVDPTASTMQTMDPNEQGAFPTHLVIRTRNMRITQRTIGAADLSAAIDAILAKPNDPNAPRPAPAGTIYPGPTSLPDCTAPNACTGPAPSFTCPGGTPGTSRCTDVGGTCQWLQVSCPPPPEVIGICSDAARCGPTPPPFTCSDGSPGTLVCQELSDGSCTWGGYCGAPPPPPPPSPPPGGDCTGLCGPLPPSPPPCPDGSPLDLTCEVVPSGNCGWVGRCANAPPPPPPPPPPVDCTLADACGPEPTPSACPDGSAAVAQCLDVGGSCGWLEFCPKPAPPPVDCTGLCAPLPVDVCAPGTSLTYAECVDFGERGGCDWAYVCSGGDGSGK